MTKRREFLLAALSMLISTVLFFVFSEIVLRFLPVATGLRSVAVTPESPVFHFTPDRPFVFSKEWNFQLVNRGRVNNAGFLNDQDYRKDGERPLLAIIGDSFIEAQMVPYPETIQGRLAKIFGTKARIYSFAASGAPLSQYLIWSRYAVREYRASALVINVVGNDFDESHIAHKAGPGFWHYTPDANGTLHLKLVELHRGFAWSIIQRSALARYLFINLQVNRYMGDFGWMRSLVVGRVQEKTDKPRFAGNTEAAAGAARINASITAIDAFFRDLPEFTGLPPNRILFTMDGFRYPDAAIRGAGTYFDQMRHAFQERARARKYEVIDMDPIFFTDFHLNHEHFEHLRDAHWNSRTHGLVAQAILSSVLVKSFPVSQSLR